jgi:hypothetical protein
MSNDDFQDTISNKSSSACVKNRMLLSDKDIFLAIHDDQIRITPFDPSLIQPASLDVRLGNTFRVFECHKYACIDPRKPQEDLTKLVHASEEDPFVLHPGQFALGTTLERISLPNDIVARLEGKSSLGRLGLAIHSTAGYIVICSRVVCAIYDYVMDMSSTFLTCRKSLTGLCHFNVTNSRNKVPA